LRADPNVYITDQYWDLSESRRDRRVVDDPMPTLREREERLAEYHVMREDATPSERDVLASLADGGKLDVDEVSESADVSERTVYRAAETFETIVDVSDRVVQLGDEVVRDKVSQLVSSLSNATEWVEDSLETIRERRGTYIDDDSAFARWMRTYGVNLDRSGAGQDELAIHVGHFDLVEIRKVLREGLRAARVTGHNLHDLLLDSAVSYYDTDGHRRRDEIPFAIQGNSIAIKGALLEQIG
jgi:AcrR family transcriptional regulator